MKREDVLTAGATLAAITLIAIVSLMILFITSPARDSAFRAIDDVLAIQTSQGWAVVSAPTDGRRYQSIGTFYSDPANGEQTARGSFRGGGRRVDVVVTVPAGKVYLFEGLEPIDHGPLTYAVLARDLPK
ncbi:MAG: hypothetical protein C0478_13420 [Planctomyces sp.]|jgi:hypothetical protein|nr:hypothetical protein [Planctomyces sp.]